MPAPVIIVTGVSRGIGHAIAEELQSRGAAAVVVGAARSVAHVPATASLLPVAADVTQETGRKALPEAALARHDSDYITGQLLAVDGGYLAQGLPG
jgi:NAD(P)-dependent dehydrogenase (short-subunit alcohol dehydrogenase family)